MFIKSNIQSIGELEAIQGRTLTPVFKGSMFPVLVPISDEEFKLVQGDKEAMKDLAIQKLNGH